MWKIIIIVALAAVSYVGCEDKERKLTSLLNPGCSECGNETTLVYTRADDAVDSVHTLWDTSGGKPTVIIAHTKLDANLTITWEGRRPVQFQWNGWTTYSFAYIVDEIWEFDDLNDTGSWMNQWPTERLDTAPLAWSRVHLSQSDSDVSLSLRADLDPLGRVGGYIELNLHTVSSRRESPRLPHLLLDSNSSLVEVALVNASAGRYNHSRLALSLRLVSDEFTDDSWNPQLIRTLDDEHTPGVFKLWRAIQRADAAGLSPLRPERPRARDGGGFLQLRPVCYTAAAREVTASTVMQLTGPLAPRTRLPRHSTAARYFADLMPGSMLMEQSMLAAFGGAGDGFYTRTNYTAWAASVGWGLPPEERFSALVVGVLAAGVAVPAVLGLAGLALLAGRAARRCGRPSRRELLID